MQLLKIKYVIILLILPVILSVSGTPNPLTLKDKASVIGSSVPIHTNPKIEKKIKTLQKKLEKLKEKKEKKKKKEKNKQARPLLIISILSLLATIALFSVSKNHNINSFIGGGSLILGFLVYFLGCITMILWLINR